MGKNNGSVVTVESDQEISARVEAEREEIKRFELSEEETAGVLKKLVARLDEYAMECALHFKDLAGCTSTDELQVLRFVHKLNPALKYLLDKLDSVLPNRYAGAVGIPADDLEYLHWELLERGFIVGLIAGAKFSGATREKLESLCRHAASEVGR